MFPDNWIRIAVRARARRRLVLSLVILAIIGLSFYGKRALLRNALHGPVDATPQDLQAGLDDPKGRNWYRVTGSRVVDTGVQQTTTERLYGIAVHRYKSAEYYVLQIGDKALLVKGVAGSTDVAGEMKLIPQDVKATVFDGVSAADRTHFYPYMLDAASDYSMPIFGGIFFALLFGVPALITLVRSVRKLGNVAGDPSVRSLENRPGPKDYVRQAEEEQAQPLYSTGNVAITPHYVVQQSYFNLRVLFLEDLLWAYVETQRRRVHGVPAGKSTYLWLKFDKANIMVAAKEAEADDVLARVEQQVPWAIFRYTKEVDDYFTKFRQEFLAWVEKRHKDPESREAEDTGTPALPS